MLFRLFALGAILSSLAGAARAQTAAPLAPSDLGPGAAQPNFSRSVQGSGIPGLDTPANWLIFNKRTGNGFDPNPTLSVSRIMRGASAPTLGRGGAYPFATLWSYTETNFNDIGNEWGVVSWVNNSQNASTGGGPVALAGTVVKQPWGETLPTTGASGDGTTATIAFSGSKIVPVGHTVWVQGVAPSGYNGKFKVIASSAGSVRIANATTGAQTGAGKIMDISVGVTWAGNLNCTDQTGESDPVASCIGLEIDNYSIAGTTDAHHQRVILQLEAGGGHVGNGILMSTKSGATIDNVWRFGGSYGTGIDFSGGTFATAPLFLAQGQKIVLDARKDGGFVRSLSVSDNVLRYHTPAGDRFAVDDNGQVQATAISVGQGKVDAGAIVINGKRGCTGTKRIGPCTLVIEEGLITNVAGC